MTRIFVSALISIACVMPVVSAHAADADKPYGNVDHRNDAGNNTGDSSVGDLNSQQLDGNYHGQNAPAGGAQPNGAPSQQP